MGGKSGRMVTTLAGALARSVSALSWKEAGVPPNEICAEPVSVAITAKKLPMRSLEVAGFFLFIKDFFDRIYAFVFDKGGDQKKRNKRNCMGLSFPVNNQSALKLLLLRQIHLSLACY